MPSSAHAPVYRLPQVLSLKGGNETFASLSILLPKSVNFSHQPPHEPPLLSLQKQEYLETEVECVRRLRERARADEAKMEGVEEELFQYEGLDMPTLVSQFQS